MSLTKSSRRPDEFYEMSRLLTDSRQNTNSLFQIDRNQAYVEAQSHLQILKAQLDSHQVSPSSVRSFYQSIHTLKALMGTDEPMQKWVKKISKLEGELACTPLIELARHAQTWLPEAEKTLKAMNSAMTEKVQNKTASSLSPAQRPAIEWGLLVAAKNNRIWLPLGCVYKVLSPDELDGRTSIYMNQRWVPVLGESGTSHFGICVEIPETKSWFVLSAARLFKVCTKSEAMQQGAQDGVTVLLSASESSLKSIAA